MLAAAVALSTTTAGCGGGKEAGSTGPRGSTPAAGGFGGQLQPGAKFGVVLIVLHANSDVVDFVLVGCAAGGRLGGLPTTIADAVEIDSGRFSARSADVAIEGRFTSPRKARGTIRALTQDARSCGIPSTSSAWTSKCDLRVKAKPRGGMVTSVTTGPEGRSYVDINSETDGFEAEAGGCEAAG